MDLKTYLKEQCARVDEALDRFLPKETELPHSLHKAMRYSVFAGGKRVRPILMLAACQAVGGDTERHSGGLCHGDDPYLLPDPRRPARHG